MEDGRAGHSGQVVVKHAAMGRRRERDSVSTPDQQMADKIVWGQQRSSKRVTLETVQVYMRQNVAFRVYYPHIKPTVSIVSIGINFTKAKLVPVFAEFITSLYHHLLLPRYQKKNFGIEGIIKTLQNVIK